MLDFTLDEAQLFRMLAGFFGRERVVPKMRVVAVCGGTVPDCTGFLNGGPATQDTMEEWARKNKCLFTIVDHDDNPKMVVEFMDPVGETLVVSELEHRQYLQPMLAEAGVSYVTISAEEFTELTDPEGTLDLFSIFREHFGIPAAE